MESHEENPVQLTPCPPYNSHGRTWERNRVSAGRGRQNHSTALLQAGYRLPNKQTLMLFSHRERTASLLHKGASSCYYIKRHTVYSENHIYQYGEERRKLNAVLGGIYSYHCDINS